MNALIGKVSSDPGPVVFHHPDAPVRTLVETVYEFPQPVDEPLYLRYGDGWRLVNDWHMARISEDSMGLSITVSGTHYLQNGESKYATGLWHPLDPPGARWSSTEHIPNVVAAILAWHKNEQEEG
ncbi:hypothetical protein [Nesterenkonia alkaliphila]|uniref:Uncharacterized protein n=1 Tax=Nesterenkonia alkaliphila TaxID=1463631 RepID=A0A7K1UH23_9MICC|nr:hypothetical protein [Nesterenkonia alkaliphila]MVT25712.1 hypothetical protein [Nesterenkonia alkaliphila]GFZ85281.1 hypothetical protein GCM10011359_12990 [Nesterenkonia alkaliphila]